jgi:predicted Mrr-cat superfamily restriction endonuclease
VTPKLPEASQLSIVRVTGTYRYAPNPDWEDYGHIVPVEVLRRGIPYSNRHIQAGLRRSLRTPGRFWSLDHQAEAIDALLALTEAETDSRDTDVERLQDILEETTEALRERLWKAFQGNQLEAPVDRLLRAVYGEDAVDKTAGPGEQGADYLIESADPFGHLRRTVVQLKAWKDKAHDRHALDQLEKAVTAYSPIDEAILLTTADGEGEEFATSRDDLAERLGCPVRFVDGATLAALFLAHLPDIAVR